MTSQTYAKRCLDSKMHGAREPADAGRKARRTRIFGFIVSAIVISVPLGSLIMAEGKYIRPSVVDLITMHLQQDDADQPPHAGY